jgi:formate dehydrogenase subunit gamma
LIAERLNVSKADVRGVFSFYHDFHDAPAGRCVVKLCRAEACQALGSERVAAHLASAHGLQPGTRTRVLALQNVYCLGNCALGPSALVDDELQAGFDERAADALIARLQGAQA